MASALPARMLRLLALLQARREWSGGELAARLGVTDRTIRRDMERLRELGYPVSSTTGTAGGYRLMSGRDLPPLLLEDEEAVAIAVGLRTAASAAVAGIEEASVSALTKLERVLPPRLRQRVGAVSGALVGAPYRGREPADADTLLTLAMGSRDREIVTFDYRDRSGAVSARRVEPYGLVASYGLWYLVGYDVRRAGWRTFRVDRLADPVSTRHRFTPRSLPAPDAASYVRTAIVAAPYRYRARALVPLSAEEARARVPMLLPDKVEALGPGRCAVALAADSPDRIVRDLVALGADELRDASTEVRELLASVAARLSGLASA